MVLIRTLLKFALGCLLLVCAHTGFAAETHTLKFATLLPTGTAWSKILDEWARDVETRSNGRIKFKMYAGGVMGDEPDVLRKIRKGQLHAGLFTGYGLGRVFSPARVLEVPFLFRNTDESDYVRDALMPDIEQGFRDNGFELLGWPEVGFIHIFSKHKIESVADIRKSRIWLWQGDPLGEAFFTAADIAPVPLSIIDVYTQLTAKHSSIDTVYTSTFGAIALQWHSKLKFATKIPFTNAIGGLIVSEEFYRQLPADLQQLLHETGRRMSDKIRMDARAQNQKSIVLLEQQGIEFVWDWDQADMEELTGIRDRAAAVLETSGYISSDFFNRARTLVTDYRANHRDDNP
jgi:TRAP-type C4-dicarboxylate transport system substrate-binding protein